MKKIMITGGAGYIGSHTAIELIKAGYEVIVFDNFCNSSPEAIKRVEKLEVLLFHTMREIFVMQIP